jgi:hypothetical protein
MAIAGGPGGLGDATLFIENPTGATGDCPQALSRQLVSYPQISSLTDDFDDNAIGAQWSTGIFYPPSYLTTGTTVAETNNRAEFKLPASTASRTISYISTGRFDATGQRVFVKIPNVTSIQAGEIASFLFGVDGFTWFGLQISQTGNMSMEIWVSGSRLSSTILSRASDTWFSIRHDVPTNTLKIDTAPDTASNPPLDTDWVNRGSAPLGQNVLKGVALVFGLRANGTSPGVPGTIVFDGLNTAAATPVANATHSGAFAAFGGTAAGIVNVAALSSGQFDAFASTATVSSQMAAAHAGVFDVFGGSATATAGVAATSTQAFDAFGGTASGTVNVAALSAGAFDAFGGTSTATVLTSATSSQAFGAFAQGASARSDLNATHVGAFGPFGGTATGTANVVALSSGSFGVFGGVGSCAVRGQAASSQAFDVFAGVATVGVSLLPLAAVADQAFAQFGSTSSGTVNVKALSDGQFATFAGLAAVQTISKAASDAAFAPFEAEATLAANDNAADLFFAVLG